VKRVLKRVFVKKVLNDNVCKKGGEENIKKIKCFYQ
jgi:hypothetical protein